jgi:hypothetical protein
MTVIAFIDDFEIIKKDPETSLAWEVKTNSRPKAYARRLICLLRVTSIRRPPSTTILPDQTSAFKKRILIKSGLS